MTQQSDSALVPIINYEVAPRTNGAIIMAQENARLRMSEETSDFISGKT